MTRWQKYINSVCNSFIDGLKNTIKYEFIDKINDHIFFTE